MCNYVSEQRLSNKYKKLINTISSTNVPTSFKEGIDRKIG